MIRSGDINETDCEELSGALLPLDEFDYSNKKIGCLIQYNIQTTNFSGITVRPSIWYCKLTCFKKKIILSVKI